jgi:hypothetical protein
MLLNRKVTGLCSAIHLKQDHEQYLPYALILPRGAAYAPLPQATKAGVEVRSHPVG